MKERTTEQRNLLLKGKNIFHEDKTENCQETQKKKFFLNQAKYVYFRTFLHSFWKSQKKVAFNIASEASYVHILSEQKSI